MYLHHANSSDLKRGDTAISLKSKYLDKFRHANSWGLYFYERYSYLAQTSMVLFLRIL